MPTHLLHLQKYLQDMGLIPSLFSIHSYFTSILWNKNKQLQSLTVHQRAKELYEQLQDNQGHKYLT